MKNEFKGTPGPWNVQFGDEVFAGDGVDNNQVATVNDCYDAQLIAAAPELLEELQKLAKLLDDAACEAATVSARAAIAKALGESQ